MAGLDLEDQPDPGCPHILAAVSVLDDILRRMEEHPSKKKAQLRALRSWARAAI